MAEAIETNSERIREMRFILDNLRHPERLDDHPWTKSRLLQAEILANSELAGQPAGRQLALAVSAQFKQMQPALPPRRGKRLDTSWGEFGILAAQYFAPLLFGTPAPNTLKDAWSKIDQAILLFVFGNSNPQPDEAERARYALVGNELETAPNSTISDWHRKGLEHLSRIIQEREAYLAQNTSPATEPTDPLQNPPGDPVTPAAHPTRGLLARLIGLLLLLCILFAGLWLGFKIWRSYELALLVRADVAQLENLRQGSLTPDKLQPARAILADLDGNISRLHNESSPLLQAAGPGLGWLPTYGADIAAAADLLEMSGQAVHAAVLSVDVLQPLVDTVSNQKGASVLTSLSGSLAKSADQLAEAEKDLSTAREIRARIPAERLSPTIRALLDRMDTLLPLMQDGLTGLNALPRLLGSSDEGPKTYMILVQNEDELRATGGFIASVGTLVVRDGQVISQKFENSEVYEDWSKPYPSAPWQMEKYMNIPVILLRDGNWSPNFPSSASLIEYLYAYQNNHSVDGILAIDQQAMVILLQAIGPIQIAGVPEEINASNVTNYMRQAKIPPQTNQPQNWNRKGFIGDMALAILTKLTSGQAPAGQVLARALLNALDQRHILLQFDDPEVTKILAGRNWDGAVRPAKGDFLMSVDTNIGYDKVNTNIDKKLTYDVDLTDPTQPKSSLAIFIQNRSKTADCVQFADPNQLKSEEFYHTDHCYYNYLRTYTPAGTRLSSASPHAYPGSWVIGGQDVPAAVDELDPFFENAADTHGFGTLLIVPGGQVVSTGFNFNLPASVFTSAPGSAQKTYSLKIEKQSGTLAIPLTVRLHLPNGAKIQSVSPGASIQGSDIQIDTNLTTDLYVQVTFTLQ